MKLMMTRNLGSRHAAGDLQEGEVYDVETEMAAHLIENGLAEACEFGDVHAVEDEELHAVPKGRRKPKAPKPEVPVDLDPVSDELSKVDGSYEVDK
jgi:hypothetical protein